SDRDWSSDVCSSDLMDSDPLTSPLITSERPMVACSMEELTVLMEPLEIGLAKFWVFNLSDGCNMVRTSRSWAACAFACRMREPDDVWANARSNYRMRLPSWQVTEDMGQECTFS